MGREKGGRENSGEGARYARYISCGGPSLIIIATRSLCWSADDPDRHFLLLLAATFFLPLIRIASLFSLSLSLRAVSAEFEDIY